jgi:hypothetical protein
MHQHQILTKPTLEMPEERRKGKEADISRHTRLDSNSQEAERTKYKDVTIGDDYLRSLERQVKSDKK